MKILPVSDVHLEFGMDVNVFVSQLADADVCVIAGDLHLARFLDQVRDAIRPFSERYGQVVYVPGNHEYYRSTPAHVDSMLRILGQEFHNVHLLEPRRPVVTLGGHRFVGSTMWFRDGPMNALLGQRLLTDFSIIDDFVPWVYEQAEAFDREVAPLIREGDIVVTHHLPASPSVHPRYRGHAGNIFFLNDHSELILDARPALWIHGHTHDACDYVIGETRVVCNPMGYPFEKKPFDPKLIVEMR